MREIRLSGSEGGGTELNRFSLPLYLCRPFGPQLPKYVTVVANSSTKTRRNTRIGASPWLGVFGSVGYGLTQV
jgi:hypothetical protein